MKKVYTYNLNTAQSANLSQRFLYITNLHERQLLNKPYIPTVQFFQMWSYEGFTEIGAF